MLDSVIETPVALLIYNRPGLTKEVFDRIAEVRPRKLLVVADGPKTDADREDCMAARAVVEQIDWKCDVERQYSDVNLGCGKRVSSGLDWVFSLVEEAIILEDDCVPHPTFFDYCEGLLARYRDTEQIMCINGTNFQSGLKRTPSSYHFSRYCSSWGWASWRRAWHHYDYRLQDWPAFRREGGLEGLFRSRRERRFWTELLNRMYQNPSDVDTWDHQWNFACWSHGGLAIEPEVNLIENRGFGRSNSTHTHTSAHAPGVSWLPALDSQGLQQLSHPEQIIRCEDGDAHIFDVVIQGGKPGGWKAFAEAIRKKARSVNEFLRNEIKAEGL